MIEVYVKGAPGRLMRSLKSVLGKSLIDDGANVALRAYRSMGSK
jgi:hypothetical protein